MGHRIKYVSILLILVKFSLCELTIAQTNDSLLLISPINEVNFYSQKFNKQLNIFYLNSAFRYQLKTKNFQIKIREDFLSTFIKSSDKSTRDENQFLLSGSLNLSPIFSTGILAQSSILSDSRKIEINSASSNNLVGFVQILPTDGISISPYFGIEVNRQIGEIDEGNIYGAEGVIKKFALSDIEVSSSFRFRNEDILPRRNRVHDLRFQIVNTFESNINNTLQFGYIKNSRDFYQFADTSLQQIFSINNNIQNRSETAYQLTNYFNFSNILSDLSFSSLVSVNWRTIDRNTKYKNLSLASNSLFDTKIEELKFESENTFNYSTHITQSSIRFIYSQRDEQHKTKNIIGINPIFFEQRSKNESQKNNVAQRFSIAIISDISMSKSDLININIVQNKLQYDTPSDDNFDDRDELFTILRIKYSRIINPFLDVFLGVEGNLNRLVYIFSERSSNNSINRVLKLNSGTRYQTQAIKSINSFEVLANYTVYDFEDINPNYKSYTFRQFLFSDSTIIRLSSNLSFDLNGYIRLSEQGDLNWNDFSMKPSRELVETFLHPKLITYFNKIKFGLGYRKFSLKTFLYKKEIKSEEAYYTSSGPSAEIEYNLISKITLHLESWLESVKSDRNRTQDIVTVNFNLHWNF